MSKLLRYIPALMFLFLAVACAPAVTPAPAPVSTEVVLPVATETLMPVPALTEPAVPVATSRGDALEASDPALVKLATGRPVLLEFFRFT